MATTASSEPTRVSGPAVDWTPLLKAADIELGVDDFKQVTPQGTPPVISSFTASVPYASAAIACAPPASTSSVTPELPAAAQKQRSVAPLVLLVLIVYAMLSRLSH